MSQAARIDPETGNIVVDLAALDIQALFHLDTPFRPEADADYRP